MLKLWIRAVGQGLAIAFVLVVGALVCKDIVEKTRGHPVAKRIIHVFHEWQFESLGAPHAATEALSAWMYNWRRAGWHIRVLTTFEAQHTELYKAMLEALSHARVAHRSRETACYLRYAAMAAVGGGWLADLDTVPTYLTPGQELSNNGDFTIYQHDSSSLMSGTKMEYERIVAQMIDALKAKTKTTVTQSPNVCSDSLVLKAMATDGLISTVPRVIPASSWSERGPCRNLTDPGHLAVQFSQSSIETLGYRVDARGVLINRTMNLFWMCRQANLLEPSLHA